jgi:hypothetical protein
MWIGEVLLLFLHLWIFFYVKLICLDGFSVSTSWLRCKSSTTVSIKVKFKSNNWKSALVAYACVNMFES